jgi:predicted lysophospholipase L1 biosynthesis ABC-type transport system permease subunit
MEQVHTLLGLVGLAIFVILVIAIAAAVTALVVRISPTRDEHPKQAS